MCRSIQAATCVPRACFSEFFRECPRAHYVEHICRIVYVRTTWTIFVGVSTCAPRGPHLFRRQINIGSRHCNLALGYDVGYIWSCGDCSDYFPAVPSLSPHLVPYVYTYLLRR